MTQQKLADLTLRVGLAFSFLYPPLNALVDPTSWIGYFPQFVRGYVPEMTLLHSFGVIEIALALWLLSGWKVFYPATLMGLMLLGIVVFDSGDFQVLFRDLSIAAIALALALAHWKKTSPVLDSA